MIEDDLSAVFKKNDWTWNIAGQGSVVPEPDDIERALDHAAKVLYNEPIGTQLEVGRLIIHKKARGHDVYVFAGTFE